MTNAPFAIIGSGINGLTAAALMAKAGKPVLVLEREAVAGGCLRTGTLAEGYTYDPLATTFVLWITGGVHGRLGDDLARHGVEFCASDRPTGVLLPDGRSLIYRTDRAANVAAFNDLVPGDGDRLSLDLDAFAGDAPLFFGLMGGDPWSGKTGRMLGKEMWSRGTRELLGVLGGSMRPMRAWLETSFDGDLPRALFAPWGLHAGLPPEAAFSGQMGLIIGYALEAAGAPVVKGGAAGMVRGLIAIIEENGGTVRTDAPVEKIVLRNGKASGVLLADGEEIRARGVLASTTPHQLYDGLLDEPRQSEHLRRYRYGRGNFQLHYALNAVPTWATPGLEKVQLLHLTPGLDGVSRSSNEAERGLLPEVPTVCVGQPCAADPSRAPEGAAVFWIQVPDAPRHIRGDAAGLIDVPPDGSWTEDLREAFADRIEDMLVRHVPALRETIVARTAISPADLEAMNVNLVGGDPYGGACTVDQFFAFRPFVDSRRHDTGIKDLWHIGASTHPGPGLSGGSGLLVAEEIG